MKTPRPITPEKAAKEGRAEIIRNLLKAKIPFSKETVFDRAVTDFRTVKRKPEHLEILKMVFDAGLTAETRIGWMNMPILCACAMYGNAAAVAHILKRQVPKDIFSRAAIGDVEYFEKAKNLARIANAKDANGFNALHYCAASALGRTNQDTQSALTRIARKLLRHGVDPALSIEMNTLSITPMLLCAWFGGNADIMKLIIQAGVSPNTPGMGVLEFALEPHQRSGEPYFHIAQTMLALGADLEHRASAQDRTMLHGTAHRGSVAPTRWLLENGARVDSLDGQGRTPLHLAAQRNTQTMVLRLLLDRGAKLNRKDTRGKTPLDYAVENKRTKGIRFLRERGAV